jgi:leucyl-tRNA synthetase
MDPHNEQQFVSPEKEQYWRAVNLYIGGSEHATGHLLYSRFWQRFLFDRGWVSEEIVFKKLVNQGMIQGRSSIVYRVKDTNKFVSRGLKDQYEVTPLHVDIRMVENDVLDIEAFKNWRAEYKDAEFILENGKYICGFEIEKMSKRWFNVITPDEVIAKYGCDTFRMYEMFLGPIEQSKPWNTEGIDGVSRFLRKYWNLFFDEHDAFHLSDVEPTPQELKILHKTIKKVRDDIERLSLNTCISSFMICVNELQPMKCAKRAILEPLTVLLSPFAPHIAEELWERMGHHSSVTLTPYPEANEAYLVENTFQYPISVNGKVRAQLELPLATSKEEVEKAVLDLEEVKKWLNGNPPKRVVVVPGRIVNVVV